MEIQTFLALLKKLPLAGTPIVVIIEGVCGVLNAKGIIALPLLTWILLRYAVLVCTASVCIFILVRLGQRTLLKAHWYSILTGILSIVLFFQPDTLSWIVLSYLGALISCVTLLSAEYTLFKRRKPSRRKQRKRVSAYKGQRNRPNRPVVLAQQQAVPAVLRQPRKVEVSSSNNLPTILIFYCNEDQHWRKKCHDQLGIFEAQGMVALWDESKISPGSIHQDEIERALASARVAILLVSASFLSQRFSQLHKILRYQKNRQDFWICPIIVSSCLYDESPLYPFQPYWSSANRIKKPLDKLRVAEQKESFRDLARVIAHRLGILTCNGAKPTEKPSREDNVDFHVPTRIYITKEDKLSFSRAKTILVSEGLLTCTYHCQCTNGEYLKHLQKIIESSNTTRKQIEWARVLMSRIIESTSNKD